MALSYGVTRRCLTTGPPYVRGLGVRFWPHLCFFFSFQLPSSCIPQLFALKDGWTSHQGHEHTLKGMAAWTVDNIDYCLELDELSAPKCFTASFSAITLLCQVLFQVLFPCPQDRLSSSIMADSWHCPGQSKGVRCISYEIE